MTLSVRKIAAPLAPPPRFGEGVGGRGLASRGRKREPLRRPPSRSGGGGTSTDQDMPDLSALILAAISKKSYKPMTAKALARKLGLAGPRRPRVPHRAARPDPGRQGPGRQERHHSPGRRRAAGRRHVQAPQGRRRRRPRADRGGAAAAGVLRPRPPDRTTRPAATRWRSPSASGRARVDDGLAEVREVVTRATRQFVGTYFERDGDALVRVDGQIFTHSVAVADAGGEGREAERQGRPGDDPLPDRDGPRRGGDRRGARPGRRPEGRHDGRRPRARHPRPVPGRGARRGPRAGSRSSARTTWPAARTSPSNSSSPSTRSTPRTSTTRCR